MRRPNLRSSTVAATLAAIAFWSLAALEPGSAQAQPDDEEIEMEGDEGAPGGDQPPPVDEGEIEMEGEEERSLEADLGAETDTVKIDTTTRELKPVSWQDIVVVMRKPFLKIRRTDLMPFLATTMNDNMIRHYSAGGQFNYFLTDVLAVGVEGQYYTKQFREPFDLVGRQARRLPTINKYNFSAALNFHYVPVYGKFAILDKKLVAWETYFTAGVGVTQSEVVPRDPRFGSFTNLLITPNIGASMRFFLFQWLTVNVGIRDYIFVDKFEPVGRSETMFTTPEQAKANADSTLINNVMFQIGVSFWIPPTFEYTTFR
ncbi:MAG: outer membrane beta-barrel domain-containing protein [Kofleriaceae bacterium]|nr:MAG: outer membrane beta-barrel domain-containing protein [Kofleriaceae bacterium]MBZ0233088.1 outer membrane beta-barrel domain-containing protein [Kofleriaceae bacterium]